MKSYHHSSAKRDIGSSAWPVLGITAAILIGVVALEIRCKVVKNQNSVFVPNHPQLALTLAPALSENVNSLHRVTELLTRPLFSPSRRPPAETAHPVNVPSKLLSRLSGVVVSPSGRFAIFDSGDGSRSIIAKVGDHVGATAIEIIAAGQVAVREADGTVMLHTAFASQASQASLPIPAGKRITTADPQTLKLWLQLGGRGREATRY